MTNLDELEKIYKDIYNCDKCEHMDSPGHIKITNEDGVDLVKPFRPEPPNIFCKEKNYDLMAIGINPGYFTDTYYGSYNFCKYYSYGNDDFKKYIKDYGQIYKDLLKNYSNKYKKQVRKDFKVICKALSGNGFIANTVDAISDDCDKDVEDINKHIYFGNVVFCPSNEANDRTIYKQGGKYFHSDIDIRKECKKCKQYILSIIEIIKPKIIYLNGKKLFNFKGKNSDYIIKYFSYNGKQLIKKVKGDKIVRVPLSDSWVNCCLFEYVNCDKQCLILELPHASGSRGNYLGENREIAIHEACKNIVKSFLV